jgi:hypothetical protein
MNQTLVEWQTRRSSERGGARLKFLIVVLVVGAMAYSGYLFIPIWYQSYLFKDLMQHNVDVASTQGYKTSWVSDQLRKSAAEYSVPADAVITPAQEDNRITVKVQFSRPVELPGYTYQYEFDYTAKSSAFLTVK